MAQYISKGSLWGRIGSGVGQGLNEQLPKEIERNRLQKGLRAIGENKNLDQFQQFTELVGAAHEYPQVVQSGANILNQQARNKASIEAAGGNKAQYIEPRQPATTPGQKGIATAEGTQEAIEPELPRNYNERYNAAAQAFNQSPKRFNNDFQNALEEQNIIDTANLQRSQGLQAKRQSQQGVQDRLDSELDKVKTTVGADVPGDVYNSIRQQARNSLNPKNEKRPELGGEGLTEEQAAQKYGKELDKISKQYQQLKDIGVGQIAFDDPRTNLKNLKAIGDSFRERGDEENLALKYIAKQDLTPEAAYYLAYPIQREKALNNSLSQAPDLSKGIPKFSQKELMNKNPNMTFEQIDSAIDEKRKELTYDLAKKLAPQLGQLGSPLAVSMQLRAMGYDPDIWIDYLNNNYRKHLNESQINQLGKATSSFVPNLQDKWLFFNSGLDKLVEQK